MNMCIILRTAMFTNPRRISLHIRLNYSNPPVKRNAYSSMTKFSINALRYMASLPPIQMWVVKKN